MDMLCVRVVGRNGGLLGGRVLPGNHHRGTPTVVQNVNTDIDSHRDSHLRELSINLFCALPRP